MNTVKRGLTLSGMVNYTITIGRTTFVRTNWNDIITILSEMRDSNSVDDAGYGKGVYSGD